MDNFNICNFVLKRIINPWGKMNKIALITGATSGIGKACAEKFASNNYNLIITGRRKNLLEEFSLYLQDTYKIKVLALNFDVRIRNEVENSILSLEEKWKKIDILINNAGLAVGLDTIQNGIYDDWERMIDTNIKGLLIVSRAIIPLMLKNGSGHIINIGSIAGKETYLKGNVYCASKHAVDSISKGMRIDLLEQNIKVTHIAPGATETEFSLVRFKGDNDRASKVYDGFKPLSGGDIAEVVFYVTTLPGHVNINDLVITPTAQANSIYIHRKE